MIYLEHPSFGIQLQHLTEGGKVRRGEGAFVAPDI